jgi:hypothetical protein
VTDMPYFRMNLGRGQGKAHIAVDDVAVGGRTLCGREIKAEVSWSSITELSGDECGQCARKTEWVERSGNRVPAAGLVLLDALLDGEPINSRLPSRRGPH